MRTIDGDLMISEEYVIWKEKVPFLYDRVTSHFLRWPSQTIQWLPDRVELPDGEYSVQKLILGTHAAGDFPNYLFLAEVQLPLENVQVDPLPYEAHEVGHLVEAADPKFISTKARIVQQINHDGEVNRARYMSQNNCIVATNTVNGDVFVFDRSKHPSKPLGSECVPDLRLKGHVSEGFGLSWSPFVEGLLLSSASDAQICFWDIRATSVNKSLDALLHFKVPINQAYEPGLEDVAWHLTHDRMFSSAGNDHILRIWDLRTPTRDKPIHSVVAHKENINCLAFNPCNEWLLATGSRDETVKLFDIRKICENAMHTICARKGDIFQVGWSPKKETILASCSFGGKVMVWDLNRIGEERTIEEARHYPSELLFVHDGHMDMVPDFSWNPCDDWAIASVDTDGILQIWKMAEHFANL